MPGRSTSSTVRRSRTGSRFDDAHPVDLVIANAGISIDKDNSSLDDFSIVRKTLDVNVGGVLNTVEPLVGRMMAAGRPDRRRIVAGRIRRPALFRVVQCQQGRACACGARASATC